MRPKYPLEAVQVLRQAQAKAGERRLAERARELDAAERELAGANAALQAARQQGEEARSSERARWEAAGTRAGALVQSLEFERGVELAERRLAATRDGLRERVLAAERARAEAVRAFAEAKAALDAVERHHHDFDAEARARAEQRDEEAALEPWSAGRGSGLR